MIIPSAEVQNADQDEKLDEDNPYRCPGCARMHAVHGCFPNCGAR